MLFALTALTSLASASELSDAMRDAAPTDKDRTVDVHIEREINASADEVWAVLGGGFSEIGTWAALVESSWEMEAGDVPATFTVDPDAPVQGRYTRTGFGVPAEVLVNYDDADRALTFWATDLPDFLVHSQNTQQVISTGEGTCVVSFDIHAQPKKKMMRRVMHKKFSSGLGEVLDDLAVYAETGSPSPAKQAGAHALE